MNRDDFSSIRVAALAGEEFQRSERLSEILDIVVDPATKDFNYDVLNAEGFSAGKLAELIIMFPMMADRRVVVLRDFDRLHPETRKKAAEVIAGTPETSLVIVEGDKVSLSPKPPAKHFLKESFKRIYENKLPTWIKGRFAKRKKKVTDRAIALFLNNVGDGLRELDGEIEKVTITVGDNDVVDDMIVEQVIGTFKRHTVWAFCNAVGLGDFGDAVRILENLMENEKNKETWYIASLASHIMKIAEYNRLKAQGAPHSEAMKTVTESTFLWDLNRMSRQTANFSERTARRALTVLGRTESTLKKSGMDKRLLMELMVPFVMPGRVKT